MATERQIYRLYRELRRKYWKKSDDRLVGWELVDDINTYKKYAILNLDETAELFAVTVNELEGEGAHEIYADSTESGDLRELFLTEDDYKIMSLFSRKVA